MTWGPIASGIVRNPHGLQPRLNSKLQLNHGQLGHMQGNNANTHQAIIISTKSSHCTVVRSGGAITQSWFYFRAGVKWGNNTVCCKNQLFFEPQHIHGNTAIIAIKSSQRLNLF